METTSYNKSGVKSTQCALYSAKDFNAKADFVYKVSLRKSSLRKINILNQLGIASTIISYLTPDEGIDLLSIHPKLYYTSNTGWIVLKNQCRLQPYEYSYISSYMTRIILESNPSYSSTYISSNDTMDNNQESEADNKDYKSIRLMNDSLQTYNMHHSSHFSSHSQNNIYTFNDNNNNETTIKNDDNEKSCHDISYYCRHLVLHAIRQLGFVCTRCSIPLDGINGLFACTNLCSTCSLRKFRWNNAPYVEGTIKFYLIGNQSITSTGKAFLTPPYWVQDSSDDVRTREEIVRKHGSVFELAQRIYEEKVRVTLL
jgi:hypothetical protein